MASMQFRTFAWPVEPHTLRIRYRRETKTEAGSNGLWTVANIARMGRVFEGEGVFLGPSAPVQFQTLAALLQDGVVGTLTIPEWGSVKALLTELEAVRTEGEELLRYRYQFLEVP